MTGPVLPAVEPNATVRPRIRRLLLWGAAATAFLLAALLIAILVTESVGLTVGLLAAVISTTAIGVVLPVFLWVDRLEAEPARMLWFAFLWGALIATSASLLVNTAAAVAADAVGLDPDVVAGVVSAPVAEELFKGLGLLLIFVVARREFNGVVDGIVYGGVVALGFAYVEDIFYLAQNYQLLGQEGLVATFVLRCLVTPFAHPMFTICTGIGLGLIAHRRTWSRAWVPLLGYAVAVAGHALWNASALSELFLLLFVLVQVPLFVGFVLVVVYARRAEARMMREHLTGYGLNGWFTPAEVAMLVSPSERRRARAWARDRVGPAGASAMRAFQDEAAELAIARDHLERGDLDHGWVEREQRLLSSVTLHRHAFAGPSASGVGVGQQGA
jgi:protease PrsW